jgi:hypothetical protein
MSRTSPEPADFGVIQEQFDSLNVALGNLLERSWPHKLLQHPGSRVLVLGLYKGAQNTLAASRFLLADTPNYPARKPELALAVSPLNRALLDAICSIVYLFGDLTGRTQRFYKAGWREMLEETNRIRDEYGG